MMLAVQYIALHLFHVWYHICNRVLNRGGSGVLYCSPIRHSYDCLFVCKVQVVFTETGTFSRELPAVAEVRLASEVPKLKHKVPKRRSLGRRTEPQDPTFDVHQATGKWQYAIGRYRFPQNIIQRPNRL